MNDLRQCGFFPAAAYSANVMLDNLLSWKERLRCDHDPASRIEKRTRQD